MKVQLAAALAMAAVVIAAATATSMKTMMRLCPRYTPARMRPFVA